MQIQNDREEVEDKNDIAIAPRLNSDDAANELTPPAAGDPPREETSELDPPPEKEPETEQPTEDSPKPELPAVDPPKVELPAEDPPKVEQPPADISKPKLPSKEPTKPKLPPKDSPKPNLPSKEPTKPKLPKGDSPETEPTKIPCIGAKKQKKDPTPVEDETLTIGSDSLTIGRPGESPLSYIEPDVISSTFYLRLRIGPNFEPVRSRPVTIQGKRCYINVSRGQKNGVDHMRTFLIISREDMQVEISYNVDLTFTLLSPKETYSYKIPPFIWDWRWPQSYGYADFIQWSDLQDPSRGFVKNNIALLKIDLALHEPSAINYA